MPDINSLFPSKYLQAADAETPLHLTIFKVSQETMKQRDGSDALKPVIWFREQTKGMVLNRTNAKFLSDLYGKDYDNWMNQRVTLGVERITAFGETQDALRFVEDSVKLDPAALMKAYLDLYAKAKKLEVPDLETYVIDADASAATITELGKELRIKVAAAEMFR